MAIFASSLTSGEGGTGVNSVNTASISPGASKLILVAVGSKINTSTPNIPTVSGAGMTWTQIATEVNTIPQQMRITLFRALSSSPGSGALTVSFGGQNQERLTWTVTEVSGTPVTGTNGSDAIVQIVTGGNTLSTSLNLSLSPLAKPTNGTYGTVNVINDAITPGSGYTELSEADSAETNHQDQYRPDGSTAVNWSWPILDKAVGIGVEIAANDTGGSFLFNMI